MVWHFQENSDENVVDLAVTKSLCWYYEIFLPCVSIQSELSACVLMLTQLKLVFASVEAFAAVQLMSLSGILMPYHWMISAGWFETVQC